MIPSFGITLHQHSCRCRWMIERLFMDTGKYMLGAVKSAHPVTTSRVATTTCRKAKESSLTCVTLSNYWSGENGQQAKSHARCCWLSRTTAATTTVARAFFTYITYNVVRDGRATAAGTGAHWCQRADAGPKQRRFVCLRASEYAELPSEGQLNTLEHLVLAKKTG